LCSEHNKHHNDGTSGYGTSTTTGTTTTTTTTTGHHHGRDAALGAGAGAGVGAAGVGLAHRGKHDSLTEGSFDQHGNRIGGASNIEQSGHRPTTDMYVQEAQKHGNSGLSSHSGSGTTTHDTTHGAPHEKESLMHKITKKLSPGNKNDADTHGSTTDSSHTGRNAALAGGAGAGLGAAAYGADKHHGSSTSPTTHGTTYGSSDTYPTNTSTSRAVDPSTSGSSHNYGRDATLAGGAAGVGGATYAAGRHHDGTSSTVDPTYGSHGGTSTINPYSTTTSHSTTDPTRSNATTDHHYGRDAAVAGGAVGAGGAAYEADQHHRQKELEKEMQKQHKHDEKEMEKDLKKQHKHDEKEYEKDLKKQHKHDEKEMAKEQKHAEKLHEKEETKHEKESKGGLFGLSSKHFRNDTSDTC
jgi:hypothetical protein